MKLGFIGAGKAGGSLSRYFASKGLTISGFYSKTLEHARQAADSIHSVAFLTLEEVVSESDMIFVTTPDGEIGPAWEKVKMLQKEDKVKLEGKVFCHCSGSLSSEVFGESRELGVRACSAHPMWAIDSQATELENVFFTLEGSAGEIKGMLERCGNPVTVIDPALKARYHAAQAIVGNLTIGLVEIALKLLEDCGFGRKDALQMLAPLMRGNLDNICARGPAAALTGAVERRDVGTVERHLASLAGDQREIYRLLSCQLVPIAQQKNPKTDYTKMKDKLEEKSNEKYSSDF